MRTYQAILLAGAVIAVCSSSAILWAERYQINQPFEPMLFKRYDRWTGRVELCSSSYDQTTYCGTELVVKSDGAVRALHASANRKFLASGYSQEEISRWSPNVLEGARNIVRNGGSEGTLKEFVRQNTH